MDIVWIGSPNFDHNRKPIDRIIIHWMAGTLASTDAVFQDRVRGTSAHFGIENKIIHQYVKTEDVAYQAGVYAMNQRSIGIEHSAQPGRDATPETLETSAQLVSILCKQYSIPIDRTHILKHSEVKATQCPGTIPIDSIVARALQISKGEQPMIADSLFKEALLDIIKSQFNDDFPSQSNDDLQREWLKQKKQRVIDAIKNGSNPPSGAAELEAAKAQLAQEKAKREAFKVALANIQE